MQIAPIEKWDTFFLCNWLGKNGFDKYVAKFSKYDIDGEMLQRDVTDEHLMKDVGMSFLKVKALRRKIQEYTQQQLLAKTGDATDGRDVDTDESLGKSKEPGKERWICTSCMFFNTANAVFCDECGSRRPVEAPEPSVATSTAPMMVPAHSLNTGVQNTMGMNNPMSPGHMHATHTYPSTASPGGSIPAHHFPPGAAYSPSWSNRPQQPTVFIPPSNNQLDSLLGKARTPQFDTMSTTDSIMSYRMNPYNTFNPMPTSATPSVAGSVKAYPGYRSPTQFNRGFAAQFSPSIVNAPAYVQNSMFSTVAGRDPRDPRPSMSESSIPPGEIGEFKVRSFTFSEPPTTKRTSNKPNEMERKYSEPNRAPTSRAKASSKRQPPKDYEYNPNKSNTKKPSSTRKRKRVDLWRKWRVVREEGVFVTDEESRQTVHLACGTVITDRAAGHNRIRVQKPLSWLKYMEDGKVNIVCLGDPFVHLSLCINDAQPMFHKEICDTIGSFLSHIVSSSKNKLLQGTFNFNKKCRIGFVVRTPPHHQSSWVLTRFQLHLEKAPLKSVKFRMSLVPYDRDIPNPEPIYVSSFRSCKKDTVRWHPSLMIPSYPNQFLVDIQTNSMENVRIKLVKPNYLDFIRLSLFYHDGKRWKTKGKMMLPCTFEMISVDHVE